MAPLDRAALIAWVKQEAHSWKQQAKDDGVHERHSGMVYAERQHQHPTSRMLGAIRFPDAVRDGHALVPEP